VTLQHVGVGTGRSIISGVVKVAIMHTWQNRFSKRVFYAKFFSNQNFSSRQIHFQTYALIFPNSCWSAKFCVVFVYVFTARHQYTVC